MLSKYLLNDSVCTWSWKTFWINGKGRQICVSSFKISIWYQVIFIYRVTSVHLIPQLVAVMVFTICNRSGVQTSCLYGGILLPTVLVSYCYKLQTNVTSSKFWSKCRIDEWFKSYESEFGPATSCQLPDFCVVKSCWSFKVLFIQWVSQLVANIYSGISAARHNVRHSYIPVIK